MRLSIPHTETLVGFLKRWQTPILLAICLLAAVLRFYRLPDMPPGLFNDEAWSGVMARQVLQTGRLQVFFPTNEGVEPIVVYLAVPIVALWGSPIWQLRIPEAVAGTLTIPALWWMCRELYGRRSARADNPPTDGEFVLSSLLGLGSALSLAILFWHINLSRIGMEPILVPLFLCLTFATLARALEKGRNRDYVLAGVVLAGNLYTYKAGYAVPLLAAAYVGMLALAERGFLKREWRKLALWIGVALLVYTPMMIYAATYPADFFERFISVTTENNATPSLDVAGNAVKVLAMFFLTGDDNQRHNIPERPALDPALAILFLIGLGRTLAGLRKPRQALPALWLVVMSLPTMLAEFAPNWDRAVGVTPMLALLSALGGISLWQMGERAGRRGMRLAAVGAVGLAVITSGAVAVRDYFVTFSDKPFLFYSFDEGLAKLAQHVNTIPADQRVYLVTQQADSYTLQYLTKRPYIPYDGRFGTVYPAPGQAATEVVILQRNRSMLKGMQAARGDSTIDWQLLDREDNPYAQALYLPAAEQPAARPTHPAEATLGGTIRLLGSDVDSNSVAPGGKINVTLYWQAVKPVSQDYTVFLHLIAGAPLPGSDALLTGGDGPPVGLSYPTSVWLPGETILDRHTITIPADAPAGEYHLHAGMYLLATLERLPELDQDGAPVPDNSIELGTVEVRAPG